MPQLHEQYIVDRSGHRKGVFLRFPEYRRVLADLEELEAIRAFDQAKVSNEKPVPLPKALALVERKWRKRR